MYRHEVTTDTDTDTRNSKTTRYTHVVVVTNVATGDCCGVWRWSKSEKAAASYARSLYHGKDSNKTYKGRVETLDENGNADLRTA